MNKNNVFSIIELMTVTLIILLLITLIIPIFSNLKLNARAALCSNQMRQIGVLITSYQSEHGGFLPNDSAAGAYSPCPTATDIPIPKKARYSDYGPNNELYRNWNGHLLPYIDVFLPAKYTRHAMVTKVGCTRWDNGQLGGPVNGAPADVSQYGWAVVNEAFTVGGYNDLKIFICPEIHTNAYDINVSNTYNGIKIPRISQLCNIKIGFSDVAGYDCSMDGGIPTTYLANSLFFGLDNQWSGPKQSYRGDQIKSISQKAFLLEGGTIGTSTYYSEGDLSSYSIGKNSAFNFVHDNLDQFWIMPGKVQYSGYFPNTWWDKNTQREVILRFNAEFAPKAYMIDGGVTWGYGGYGGNGIVTYVDPAVCIDKFTKFFSTHFPGTLPLNPFVQYTDEPNEYKFTTGNMNVLFGDGAVSIKDQAWLINNRQLIASPSQE